MALNLPVLAPQRFYALDPKTGRVVSHGSVTFYFAGTTALRTVYADREGTIAAANPVTLDAAGSCEVYLSGVYRIEVRDAAGAVVYSRDQVNSIPVETTEGNPGSLLASNNLSDLTDVAVAREALGIAKQTSVSDATANRILIMGAFGLGGSAVQLTGSGALNAPGLPSGLYRVAASDVASVGGPDGAADGLVLVMRFSANRAHQVWYQANGFNVQPWSRIYSVSEWGPWRRDSGLVDAGAGRTYRRDADGTQTVEMTVTGIGPISTALGSAFQSANVTPGAWPVPFKSGTIPTVVVDAWNASIGAHVVPVRLTAATATNAGQYALTRFTSAAQTDFVLRVRAEGVWF